MTTDKPQLRQQMRTRRRGLSRYQQTLAAKGLLKRLGKHPLFTESRHIAVYLASDGEIDPTSITRAAIKQGKRCYLPVIRRDNTLWFRRYFPGQRLMKNRFGIYEPPPSSPRIAARELDLVLLPLVAFDRHGGRLGMGGGFYDRTFAFQSGKQHRRPPFLVGLAHHFQEVEKLELEPWDVRLQAVMTDRSCFA